jgi:hypothetical protein
MQKQHVKRQLLRCAPQMMLHSASLQQRQRHTLQLRMLQQALRSLLMLASSWPLQVLLPLR